MIKLITILQRLSVARALQQFFPSSKTSFWWTSIKCIHDNNGERRFRNHSVFQCQFSEYPSCSFIFTWLVDKQKLRSKTYKIVWSAFSFVSLIGSVLKLQIYSVQPQQHETELNIIINCITRMNYKNLTANLLRLSLPFYYWQSHLPYGSADGLLCIQFACLVFQPRLKLVTIDLWIYLTSFVSV